MKSAPATVQLATEHARAGRTDEAIALLVKHLRFFPRDGHALVLLAQQYAVKRDFERGELFYGRALALAPGNAQLRSDHAHMLLGMGRYPEAIAQFREALRIDPGQWMASSGLAQAHFNRREYLMAAEAAEEGVRRNPDIFPNLYHLSRSLILVGRIEEAINYAQRGIGLAPKHQQLRSVLAVALTYSDRGSPDEIAEAYWANGRALEESSPGGPMAIGCTPDPDRRLRIGYISPDIRQHSVAYFLEPILANHDPSKVHIFAYSTTAFADTTTERLKSLITRSGGEWVEAYKVPHNELAARIVADCIDVLVDLAGHSEGNALSVLMLKPAPVQVTYMGWAMTTGLSSVDWRIVDGVTDPPGYESHSTERLARLEGCFLCYSPERDAPEPEMPEGPITFGSFNAVYKISRATIHAWSESMRAVPGSRLILKATHLEEQDCKRRILASFAEHGIDADRLELLGRTSDVRSHLGLYNRIHIALDTVPYNGTTTTCEALWMGVPVITTQGNMHHGRVSMSLLRTLGLDEWVARDEAEFVRIAAALAADDQRLRELRGSLRTRMKESALCEGAAFTRRLEDVYRRMWHQWCQKAAT